jgi:hypothetical protein
MQEQYKMTLCGRLRFIRDAPCRQCEYPNHERAIELYVNCQRVCQRVYNLENFVFLNVAIGLRLALSSGSRGRLFVDCLIVWQALDFQQAEEY